MSLTEGDSPENPLSKAPLGQVSLTLVEEESYDQ
jgi:hypothetical protein